MGFGNFNAKKDTDMKFSSPKFASNQKTRQTSHIPKRYMK